MDLDTSSNPQRRVLMQAAVTLRLRFGLLFGDLLPAAYRSTACCLEILSSCLRRQPGIRATLHV